MFRNLPANRPDQSFLDTLAAEMVESGETTDTDALPAGLTYLGQFIDHDLTFDTASMLERQNDPDALTSFRTPGYDLDSVYGRGPSAQPYLYVADDLDKLLTGFGESPDANLNDPVAGLRREGDLPRNSEGIALLGDPRNDENIIVGQLHLAFVQLHNRLVDDLRANAPGIGAARWAGATDFQEAQRLTRWHYQWVVLKEFLPTICDPKVLNERLSETRVGGGLICRRITAHHYEFEQRPYIPVEWSAAAYRFGHSMIRPSYHLNATLRGFRSGAPIDIFIETPTQENRLQHLAGSRVLPPFWTLDWRMFFRFPGDADELQLARRIDTKLAGGLRFLPNVEDAARALALRNLKRGASMGLPSGQAVARRLCRKPLSRTQLGFDEELRCGSTSCVRLRRRPTGSTWATSAPRSWPTPCWGCWPPTRSASSRPIPRGSR